MFTHITGFMLSRVDVGTLEVVVAREETPACPLITQCLARTVDYITTSLIGDRQ